MLANNENSLKISRFWLLRVKISKRKVFEAFPMFRHCSGTYTRKNIFLKFLDVLAI